MDIKEEIISAFRYINANVTTEKNKIHITFTFNKFSYDDWTMHLTTDNGKEVDITCGSIWITMDNYVFMLAELKNHKLMVARYYDGMTMSVERHGKLKIRMTEKTVTLDVIFKRKKLKVQRPCP